MNNYEVSAQSQDENKPQGADRVQQLVENISASGDSLLELSNGSSFIFFGNRFDPKQSIDPNSPINYALVVDNDLSAFDILELQEKINVFFINRFKLAARCDATMLEVNIAVNTELAKNGGESIWDTLGISQNPQFHLLGNKREEIRESLVAAIQAHQKK